MLWYFEEVDSSYPKRRFAQDWLQYKQDEEVIEDIHEPAELQKYYKHHCKKDENNKR